jgi:flagellar biosynthesis chaperone FliJ
LQQERDRAEALARELTRARDEIEAHVALSSKTGAEAAQVKQAAESVTAELRQSLQQERDRAEALARELTRARDEIEAHAALSSKTGAEAAQVKQAAESITAELRQSLQQERNRAEALTREIGSARRIYARIAFERKANSLAALPARCQYSDR